MGMRTLWGDKSRLYPTAAYFAAFVALGLTTASMGPTLTHLADNTGADLNKISLVFTMRALGYLCGSVAGGWLYDRVRGHPVMAVGLTGAALLMGAAPLLRSLWPLMGVLFLIGMCEGAVDVGGHTLLVWVHGAEVGPFMNALHFFFGVGAFLAPLIIAQVLGHGSGARGAYWILALLLLPVAGGLLRVSSPRAPTATPASTGASAAPRPGAPLLVFVIALFFFLYVGAEGSLGGWLATYVKASGLGDATTGAYLTSAFWGALMVGRLLAVPLATRLRPSRIMLLDLVGCALSVGVMVIAPRSPVGLWLGACGAGLTMASIFPTMISLAERRLVITGGITSCFFVGSSLGGMTLPWLIGQLFTAVGPQVTMGAILLNTCLTLGVFLGISRAPRLNSARS